MTDDAIRDIVLMSLEEAIGKSVAEVWQDYQGDDEATAARLHEIVDRGQAMLALARRELKIAKPE